MTSRNTRQQRIRAKNKRLKRIQKINKAREEARLLKRNPVNPWTTVCTVMLPIWFGYFGSEPAAREISPIVLSWARGKAIKKFIKNVNF